MTTEKKLLAVLGLGVGYIVYDKLATNNKENAIHLLNTWMKNVNTHDIDKVVNLYSEDAVLLPTLSNVSSVNYEFLHGLEYLLVGVDGLTIAGSAIAEGREKIRLYMIHFLSLFNLKGRLYPDTIIFKQLSMNKFVVDGMYMFNYEMTDVDGNTTLKTNFARYTFIFARKPLSNEWLITNQNSNQENAYSHTIT